MDNFGKETKSDIEEIMGSQTWKSLSPKIRVRPKPVKLPRIKEVVHFIEDSPIEKVIESKSPLSAEPIKKKSLLAIPIGHFTSRIKNYLLDEDLNYAKIPLLPKFPFGKHVDMLDKEPEFKVVPKEILTNSESVNSIKFESGRMKRTITTSPLQFKKKKKNKAFGKN
ncbi:hypothetical protein SteCoe_19223 [Stentor coeruleus]|uniref:Uncharacterized protein n=1 Tax=Stentor coeruleus TaxID=5963 RepID=A0A1R2BUU5_9CILI|nr:hypothetical protein SteCoe_19223 [Stentor coeruleus]